MAVVKVVVVVVVVVEDVVVVVVVGLKRVRLAGRSERAATSSMR